LREWRVSGRKRQELKHVTAPTKLNEPHANATERGGREIVERWWREEDVRALTKRGDRRKRRAPTCSICSKSSRISRRLKPTTTRFLTVPLTLPPDYTLVSSPHPLPFPDLRQAPVNKRRRSATCGCSAPNVRSAPMSPPVQYCSKKIKSMKFYRRRRFESVQCTQPAASLYSSYPDVRIHFLSQFAGITTIVCTNGYIHTGPMASNRVIHCPQIP